MADIADAVGADPVALGRLLRTLSSLGVFTESEPGVFAVTPLGRTLASDEPGSVRDMALMWMETHYDPFSRLVDTVKTGVTAADLHYGEPFFDWVSQHPEQITQFTKAMANLTTGIKAGAVAAYDFNGAGTIVDIGAADGAVLAQILAGTPTVTGVAFDLPHVIADAGAAIKGHGLGDRLTSGVGQLLRSRAHRGGHVPAFAWFSTTGTTSGRAKFWRTSASPPSRERRSSPWSRSCPPAMSRTCPKCWT